jgi:hypothetical protein
MSIKKVEDEDQVIHHGKPIKMSFTSIVLPSVGLISLPDVH